jgi:hypothetical protein
MLVDGLPLQDVNDKQNEKGYPFVRQKWHKKKMPKTLVRPFAMSGKIIV